MSPFICRSMIVASMIAGLPLGSAYSGESVGEIPAVRLLDVPTDGLGSKAPVISTVVISRQGNRLATVGDDHLVRIFSLPDGQLLHRLIGHSDWVRAAAFRPDGKVLATSGDDRQIMLWDVESGRPQARLQESQAIYTLAFSTDGERLAAAGFEDKVVVYDAQKGRVAFDLVAPGPRIDALAFSPDGAQLAAAGRTGAVRLWNTADGQGLRDLGTKRGVRALAYSPDGKILAVGGDLRSISLFDPQSGALIKVLPERPTKIRAMVFCGNGTLASGGSDNLIRLWDVANGAEKNHLVGHTGSISSLAWDDLGKVMVSGSFDTTVRIWQWSGEPAQRLSRRPASGGN